MDEFSLTSLGVALAVLIVFAGFFSIAETAMMAVNRYRLKHQAQRGARGAKLAMNLLGMTDKLLGVISFHDVANAVIKETSFHNRLLKSYIKNWPDDEKAEK